MNFDPKSADKVLIPDGWYDAEIVEAKDKTSKAGNPMMEVMYAVYASAAPEFVFDYFVTGMQSSISQMKKLCHALGLADHFEKGSLSPELLKGKPVKLQIKTQKAKEDSAFGPKNVAANYANPKDATAVPAPVAAAADSDVPF